MRPICFYSDFGSVDDFAGTCRAVIARVAPDVRVIDITHGLRQRDVRGGAIVLRNTLPYMPDGAVHLAVVDPGVGWERRAVVLCSADGRLFVGPDNGLLMPAAEAAGGVSEAVQITSPGLWLEPLSQTFHARDIFAPVAARLASGLAPGAAGEALDPASLVRIPLPAPRWKGEGVIATVVLVDSFGNAALNLDGAELERMATGEAIQVVGERASCLARIAGTFSEVAAGELVVLVDGYGQAAVAVNGGSAAERLHLTTGVELWLGRPAGDASPR